MKRQLIGVAITYEGEINVYKYRDTSSIKMQQ